MTREAKLTWQGRECAVFYEWYRAKTPRWVWCVRRDGLTVADGLLTASGCRGKMVDGGDAPADLLQAVVSARPDGNEAKGLASAVCCEDGKCKDCRAVKVTDRRVAREVASRARRLFDKIPDDGREARRQRSKIRASLASEARPALVKQRGPRSRP